MIVTTIDGMDAIAACYTFAGVVGIHPRGLTLCQLWRMAEGKLRALRYHQIGQSFAIFGMADADPIVYAEYGKAEPTGYGKPLEHSPEMQEQIDARIAEIYEQNPGLKESTKYGTG